MLEFVPRLPQHAISCMRETKCGYLLRPQDLRAVSLKIKKKECLEQFRLCQGKRIFAYVVELATKDTEFGVID